MTHLGAALWAIGLLGVGSIACEETAKEWPSGLQPLCGMSITVPQRRDLAVDVLLVVETTPGMAQTQARLGLALRERLDTLVRGTDEPADVHVGVTTADLGAGPYTSIPGCDRPGGDDGRLLAPEHCQGPVGASYLVDVTPRGCDVQRVADASCIAHECTQAHCDLVDPVPTWLVQDADGCPRCRNYLAPSLAEAVACLALLGEGGCGFAQPIEAALKALEDRNRHPAFLREDTGLGLLFAVRQDDCSAAMPERLFDPAEGSLESLLGPLTPFRCFEHGVTCDVDDRLAIGWRQGCAPREEPGGLLTPVDQLHERLAAIKAPQFLGIVALAGVAADGAVRVERDLLDRPALAPTCETADASPLPAIRLRAFVSAFNPQEELDVTFLSACEPQSAERVIGWLFPRSHYGSVSPPPCLPAPLLGCTDPGAASGEARDDQQCNDACQVSCWVVEASRRGTEEETRLDVPPCLEICPEGPCPGNTDPARAYQGGVPLGSRDPWLPVPICFAPRYVPGRCPEANDAEVLVVRREGPAPRTFVRIDCRCVIPGELLCGDGTDNDGDCLVDAADPDCR